MNETAKVRKIAFVPVGKRVAQIPADAKDDDLLLEVSPTKECRTAVMGHLLTPPDPAQPCLQHIRPER